MAGKQKSGNQAVEWPLVCPDAAGLEIGSGERAAYPERAGTQERRPGLPMDPTLAQLRVPARVVPPGIRYGGIAGLPAPSGNADRTPRGTHPAYAKSVAADESAAAP